MSLYKDKKLDFKFQDDRGSLTQLVHDGFKQINVLASRKNSIRGAHYHKIAIEAFYVINGSVKVTLLNKTAKETVVFREGDFFEIPPFILHTMEFPEDCLMVQMYDVPVEQSNGSKDIYKEEEFYERDC